MEYVLFSYPFGVDSRMKTGCMTWQLSSPPFCKLCCQMPSYRFLSIKDPTTVATGFILPASKIKSPIVPGVPGVPGVCGVPGVPGVPGM